MANARGKVSAKENTSFAMNAENSSLQISDATQSAVRILTDSDFNNIIKDAKTPVLVDFWAIWCRPCKIQAPVIDEIAKELGEKAIIGKLDVDKNPKTSGQFSIRGIPTLMIFKDGKSVETLVGVQSKEKILQALKPYIQEKKDSI